MEEVSQEFDWSNLFVLLAGIIGFALSEIRRAVNLRMLNIKEDTTLRSRVKNLEDDFEKLEDEMRAGLKALDAKVEQKNDVISKQITNMDKKFDIKFDNLSKQILELVKSINFGGKK